MTNTISRRTFLRAAGRLAPLGLAVGAGLGGYSLAVEPRWLEVARVPALLPRLPVAFTGLTIAQISDLHFGMLIGAEQVRAAVDVVLGLKPDLAVVTGDFVSRLSHGEAELIVQELSRLDAPLGVFAILGNHDHWTDAAVVADAVRRAGLKLLRNANVALRRAGETVFLAGIDDVWEEKDDLSRALAGVPAGGCAVLMAHEPDFADEAAKDPRVVLQVSGHSHGGQVRIPGLPLVLPYLAHKYPAGLRLVGGMWVYTNRGIGSVGPPVRLNCRPEVTLYQLQPADARTRIMPKKRRRFSP